MTLTVTMTQAKTHLSKLLERVISGEEIVITKSGKPIAQIVPFEQKPAQRVPGSAKGKIWIAPDFDAPLPPEILDALEGKDIDA